MGKTTILNLFKKPLQTLNNAEVVIVPTKSSEATVEYTGANKKHKYIFNVDVKGDSPHSSWCAPRTGPSCP